MTHLAGFHRPSRASRLAGPESAAARGSIGSWQTIAIVRDRRRLWLGWLGWNGPTLTQRVRIERPVDLPILAAALMIYDHSPADLDIGVAEFVQAARMLAV
jgi:hypothetical protein